MKPGQCIQKTQEKHWPDSPQLQVYDSSAREVVPALEFDAETAVMAPEGVDVYNVGGAEYGYEFSEEDFFAVAPAAAPAGALAPVETVPVSAPAYVAVAPRMFSAPADVAVPAPVVDGGVEVPPGVRVVPVFPTTDDAVVAAIRQVRQPASLLSVTATDNLYNTSDYLSTLFMCGTLTRV